MKLPPKIINYKNNQLTLKKKFKSQLMFEI